MNAFHLLKQGQQRLQQKRNKQRHKCEHCPKTFSNAGGLAMHLKSHPIFIKDENPTPKTPLFEILEEKKSESSKKSKKRSPTIPPRRKKKVAKTKGVSHVHSVKSRNRYSNLKKYKLILQYETLRSENPRTFKDDFKVKISKIAVGGWVGECGFRFVRISPN